MNAIANIQMRLTNLVVVQLFIYTTILCQLCFILICAHAVPLSTS